MSKYYRFGLILVIAAILFALVMAAGQPVTVEAAGDCPWPPHAVYTLHLPVVAQYIPKWWDGDNSGDGVELGR